MSLVAMMVVMQPGGVSEIIPAAHAQSDASDTAETGSFLDTIWNWLGRANREYQGTVIKRLSRPADSSAEDDDSVAKAKADEARRAAAEKRRMEDERRRREAEAAKATEPPPDANSAHLEQQMRRERQRLEEEAAQLERQEALRIDEERKAAEARRLEEERINAEARIAERRRREEENDASRHRHRTITLTVEPIVRAVRADDRDDDAAFDDGGRQRLAWMQTAAIGSAGGGATNRRCRLAGRTIKVPGRYVVADGDSLWSIAVRHYDNGTLYKRIYRVNRRRIADPDRIRPCQRLYLPRLWR
jgi:nucleoid-associated protein YgaU